MAAAYRRSRRELAEAVAVAEGYECLLARIALILADLPPHGDAERALRDLAAEAFDTLRLAKYLALSGFPGACFALLRRAFELTSLLYTFSLEPGMVGAWWQGKEVRNWETRDVLGTRFQVEVRGSLDLQYDILCDWTHPNRDTVAARRLGEDEEFELGAGAPPDTPASMYAVFNLLMLWHWLVVVLAAHYIDEIDAVDPEFRADHNRLHEQYVELDARLRRMIGEAIADPDEG